MAYVHYVYEAWLSVVNNKSSSELICESGEGEWHDISGPWVTALRLKFQFQLHLFALPHVSDDFFRVTPIGLSAFINSVKG